MLLIGQLALEKPLGCANHPMAGRKPARPRFWEGGLWQGMCPSAITHCSRQPAVSPWGSTPEVCPQIFLHWESRSEAHKRSAALGRQPPLTVCPSFLQGPGRIMRDTFSFCSLSGFKSTGFPGSQPCRTPCARSMLLAAAEVLSRGLSAGSPSSCTTAPIAGGLMLHATSHPNPVGNLPLSASHGEALWTEVPGQTGINAALGQARWCESSLKEKTHW